MPRELKNGGHRATLFPLSHSSPPHFPNSPSDKSRPTTKMKLISVYVTVGAIGFVKCELNFNSVTPPERRNLGQIHTGMPFVARVFRESATSRTSLQNSSEGVSEKLERQVDVEKKKEFFPDITDIYDRCKTKVKQSSNNGKVKSRLSKLKSYILDFYHCLKVFSFRSLEETLQTDLVRITDYVYLVKDGVNVTGGLPSGRVFAASPSVPLKEFATRVLGQDWTKLLSDWFDNLLRTHSLKFQLDKSLVSQGRGRRRDQRMFAMMVMGFMIMASILIPMGFQFLTVLGGKSLLLAKMALIISAISGLKKIATSNVGYGFYHTGSDAHHHDHLHHGFHEKHYNNQQGYN